MLCKAKCLTTHKRCTQQAYIGDYCLTHFLMNMKEQDENNKKV